MPSVKAFLFYFFCINIILRSVKNGLFYNGTVSFADNTPSLQLVKKGKTNLVTSIDKFLESLTKTVITIDTKCIANGTYCLHVDTNGDHVVLNNSLRDLTLSMTV